MFNVKLGLGLDVKLDWISLHFKFFQGPAESILGLATDVELGLVNYGLTGKLFWI